MRSAEYYLNNVTKEIPIDEAVECLFQYFRKTGFPSYNLNKYDGKNELNKIIKYEEENILYNGYFLKQTMHGLGFLWTYFPHWIDVKCGNDSKSVIDHWNNDETLKKIILKTWKWQLKHGNGKFTINRIRQNSKVYGAKQSVSNFRPTVAKYIYNAYGDCGTVWDMSSGWGGRLFGFLASNCNKYIGTEPSLKSYNGLLKLSNDFSYVGKNIELHNCGSEFFCPKKESVDLCFSSPPYFDTEKYSDESTQSYIKYPTKEQWLNGYMKKTLNNCMVSLKNGGYLIINIANVKTYPNLEEDFVNIALKVGFKYVDKLLLVLSSISGKGIKTEPVFIFEK